MVRGQLPKAYLRLDPNVDRAKADTQWAFIRLLCEANRQPRRGRFRNRALFDALLGKAAARKLIAAGDAREHASGEVVVPGWDEWQEGDVTVAERQRRIRARRDISVTSPLPDRIPTPAAPAPSSTNSGSSSLASGEGNGQQGSKAPPDAATLKAGELPSESDSATLACRQLFDSGKWLGDREYVAGWEDLDRRYGSSWVQAEIAPAYAACLEARGKVLPWDLKRMTEQRLAERSRAEERQRDEAERRRLEAQATAQTREPMNDDERERQSLIRRAVGLWLRGGRRGKVPEQVDELREWIAANDQQGASA